MSAKIKDQLEKKQFTDAEASWSELENVVIANSNSVVSAVVPASAVGFLCLLAVANHS